MFTLQDLLDLPLMQSARPEVLFGEDFDQRPVRWIHTSEIFEISPLLKGGEVLFTTGLGLVGSSDGAISAYVESLAKQNVTALIMEVGRTFVQLPQEFAVAAAKYGLPLITMHRVVPFVEFTEVIHPLLISAEISDLRRGDEAFKQLVSGMLSGDDLKKIVSLTQQMIDAPVSLYSTGGQLLAGEDVRSIYSDDSLTELPVGPEPWAHLSAVIGEDAGNRRVLDTAALAVALKLSQTMTGDPSQTLAVGDFLTDILRTHFLEVSEIESRAAALGFTAESGLQLVAVVLDLTRAARSGLFAVTKVARRLFGPNLVAEIDGRIVLVIQTRPEQAFTEQLTRFADAIDRELDASGEGRLVRLVTGPTVNSVAGLPKTLIRADSGARLARRLGFPARIVTDQDLGLYDLLSRVIPDTELESFVEQQIGPLLQADARSGNRLVETLNAYLAAGQSKSAAAEMLGIRRQTMYQRMERISNLLGGIDLSSRERLTALDLAVTSWKMRTSGLTGVNENPF